MRESSRGGEVYKAGMPTSTRNISTSRVIKQKSAIIDFQYNVLQSLCLLFNILMDRVKVLTYRSLSRKLYIHKKNIHGISYIVNIEREQSSIKRVLLIRRDE